MTDTYDVWRIDDHAPDFNSRARVIASDLTHARAEHVAERGRCRAHRYPGLRFLVLTTGTTPPEHVRAGPTVDPFDGVDVGYRTD